MITNEGEKFVKWILVSLAVLMALVGAGMLIDAVRARL
jgi:hypothetical protein